MAEQPPPNPPNPPRRPKRVSLKGRGADIFFGDYTPPARRPSAEALGKPGDDPESSASQEQLHDSPQTRYEEDIQAGSSSSKQASKQMKETGASGDYRSSFASPAPNAGVEGDASSAGRSSQASRRTAPRRAPQPDQPLVDVTPDMAGEIWSLLDMHATIANTFRYTEEELTALNDVLYQLSSEQKVRVTKQEAARMGLYLVLEDYRRRGAESLLGQLAASRRFRRTGGR